jgi:hypothetical protein
VWAVPFDLARGEIWVKARVHGPLGFRDVKCLWDPGASKTIVNTPVLDALGYSAKMGKEQQGTWGVGGGRVPGYTLDVRLDVYGEVFDPHEILAQDILPDHFGVEVLLGMDLVPGRIFTIDGIHGTLAVHRP